MPIKKEKNILSVSKLNEYVRMMLDNSPVLSKVYVSGEISNFKLHIASGHIYFTLKDATSSVRAVMFKSSAEKLSFVPTDGMNVIVSGKVSSYVRDGVYQIYVSSIVPEGVGETALALEQLKEKLANAGLFDENRKKAVPKFPRAVGVITSPVGAAVNDILNITSRRYPLADIILYPAIVQGNEAEGSLVSGIKYFTDNPCVDVIIIGRGGGSGEDLFAFNSEKLAYAIYECPIPTISAVGHEHDFTISDLVADLRASTPSAAAELAVPDKYELKERLYALDKMLRREMSSKLEGCRESLDSFSSSGVFSSYERIINDKRLYIDSLSVNLKNSYSHLIREKRQSISSLAERLDMQSPLTILSKGYSKLLKDDKVITGVDEVDCGDRLTVLLADGKLDVTVSGKEKNV